MERISIYQSDVARALKGALSEIWRAAWQQDDAWKEDDR
jgi:hypothetical protein